VVKAISMDLAYGDEEGTIVVALGPSLAYVLPGALYNGETKNMQVHKEEFISCHGQNKVRPLRNELQEQRNIIDKQWNTLTPGSVGAGRTTATLGQLRSPAAPKPWSTKQ
jgi:hypothetical protein